MKLFFKLVALLFLATYSSPSFAGGGSCIDVGNMRTCHVGMAIVWYAYNDSSLALWDSTSCDGDTCTCGSANLADPCDGCGYISQYSPSACHTSNNCSGLCTPVPELPETSHALMQIIFFGSVIGFIIFQKYNSTKSELI